MDVSEIEKGNIPHLLNFEFGARALLPMPGRPPLCVRNHCTGGHEMKDSFSEMVQPRCFSRIKPEKLPVMYRSNKKAWMTSELMTECLKSVDRQMKRQGRHVLLFLNNAPAHAKIKLDNLKLSFLPANTTSVIQPMDQGIIQTFKLKYRSRQLQHILNQMEVTYNLGRDIIREISILDAIYWINGAWNEVDVSTIQKCFTKCGFLRKCFL